MVETTDNNESSCISRKRKNEGVKRRTGNDWVRRTTTDYTMSAACGERQGNKVAKPVCFDSSNFRHICSRFLTQHQESGLSWEECGKRLDRALISFCKRNPMRERGRDGENGRGWGQRNTGVIPFVQIN